MKRYLIGSIVLLSFALGGCNPPPPQNPTLYYKEKCVVVEKGIEGSYKYLIIRRVSDTTDYTELNPANFNGNFDEHNYYGKPGLWDLREPGDTLYFEHIRKERFWKKPTHKNIPVQTNGEQTLKTIENGTLH